jgi:ABC-2 type transport system permease protein
MTAETAIWSPAPLRPGERHPGSAATGAAVHLLRRGTVVLAVLAGGLPAFVAVEYRDTFANAIGVSSLTGLAENPAIRTLFGRPVALDDPGGFTVWRTGTVLAVLVGTWAVLTATRLTRGEEEAGRWDLLLSGRLWLRFLVASSLGVVLLATAVVGAAVTLGLLLAGTETTGAVLFGVLVGGTGMVGAGLGVIAAQLLPERRAASGLGVAVLLAGLLVRMVADGVPALGWAQWLTGGSPWSCSGWGSSPWWPSPWAWPGAGTWAQECSAAARCTGPAPRCSARCRPSRRAGCAARCWAGGPAWPCTSCSSARWRRR